MVSAVGLGRLATRGLCLATGHRWNTLAYPEADTADGFFLRCRRCGKENHDAPSGVNGAMGASMGPWHG